MGVEALIILSGIRLQFTVISVFFLIHIPDEMLRLCQMGNNCTERRESHSRCDVTEPCPALRMGGVVEYQQCANHSNVSLQQQTAIG